MDWLKKELSKLINELESQTIDFIRNKDGYKWYLGENDHDMIDYMDLEGNEGVQDNFRTMIDSFNHNKIERLLNDGNS